MNKKIRLVFFDFCETLIKYQTADKYVDFCRSKLRYKRMFFLQIITVILSKLLFFRILGKLYPNNTLRKRLILKQLEKVDYTTLDKLAEEYYRNHLKYALIYPMIERLLLHSESNDKIWIVSGGYDIYIKYFVKEYKLSGYISTKISFNSDGICMGKFDGIDCMHVNKFFLIREKFGDLLNKVETVAYSDSYSDLPLLLGVKEGYIVSKTKTQNWKLNNNLKEIIWE